MKFSVLVEVINLGESRNSLTFGDTCKKIFVCKYFFKSEAKS